MKYFVFDINDGPNGVVENCLDALRLATSPIEDEIICFAHHEYVNPYFEEELFEKVINQLRDADVLISFTDSNFFMSYGKRTN